MKDAVDWAQLYHALLLFSPSLLIRFEGTDRKPFAVMPLERRSFLQGSTAFLSASLVAGSGSGCALADNENVEKLVAEKNAEAAGWVEPEVTRKAFMDISIGGKAAGRLVIAVGSLPELV